MYHILKEVQVQLEDLASERFLDPETTSILGVQGDVEARFTVALPARGRSVLGGWATEILVENLPR